MDFMKVFYEYLQLLADGNGCQISPRDDRDYIAEIETTLASTPLTYRLPKIAKIYNQKDTGASVECAVLAATKYAQYKKGFKRYYNPSVGYLHGYRLDSDNEEEGAVPREVLNNLANYGDVSYVTFPWMMKYEEARDTIANIEENDRLYREAKEFKLDSYYRLTSEKAIKLFLMTYGAVIISVPVYDTFGRYSTKPTESSKFYGNHMMTLVGWDSKGWILQNSWGQSWGDRGYLNMDYDYPINEAWGLLLPDDMTEPKKKSIGKTIIDIITVFIRKLQYIKINIGRKDGSNLDQESSYSNTINTTNDDITNTQDDEVVEVTDEEQSAK